MVPAWTRLPALVATLSMIAGGCAGAPREDAGVEVAASAEGSLGLVQVERFVDLDGTPRRLVAGVKVARYRRADGEMILSLMGADSLELERCSLSRGLQSAPVPTDAEVELLSVGDIDFRAAALATRLSPRVFPLLGSAGGWFYTLDTVDDAPRAELDEIGMRAPGKDGLGAFELTMLAPRDLSDIELSGTALSSEVVVSRARELVLSWFADDPEDRIELELVAGGSSLSCACRDDGHFVVPVELLQQLEADESAALVLRRVRGTAFDMQQIDVSYATFASTRAATFSLR